MNREQVLAQSCRVCGSVPHLADPENAQFTVNVRSNWKKLQCPRERKETVYCGPVSMDEPSEGGSSEGGPSEGGESEGGESSSDSSEGDEDSS